LRALVEKKRKKKTIKENMIKMKLLYSSRNLISSSRKENLTRKKGKRSQGQIGCATITTKMSILLLNAHIKEMKKTMTRERRKKVDQGYKKDKKYTKKKHYAQAHVGQE
jgi:hypothetical protein